MGAESTELESKCKKSIEHFKKDLGRVRTGRASNSLLDGIQVEYYGSRVPLIQLGLISSPEPRQITIQVYDANAVEAVEKAIQQSELGVTPSREGSLVRLTFSALTEDRRKELVKRLHTMSEETRVVVRTHRRETNDELKKKEKDKKISSDDLHKAMEDVQKVTDKYIKEIDQILAQKEKEVMEV